MAERHVRAEHAHGFEIAHRRRARAAVRVLLLIRRFEQMHVHTGAVLHRMVLQRSEGLVRAPVQVGRRELDAHAVAAVPALPQVDEQTQVVLDGNRLGLEPLPELGRECRRQALQERLVGLVDEPALIPEGVRVRDAHANVFVGLEDLLGDRQDAGDWRHPQAVKVLHRRDAGFEHLEGGIQRVEVRIDVPGGHATREPQLERMVR